MMTEDDKTDLSNFGGGVDNTKADDPEDKDNLSLSKWLTNPSVNVYWDREKPYGYNTFSVTTQKRPDLIIDAKVNTFAVEVKDYEKTGCVINGAEQAEGYWRDIESGKAEYSINGNKVEIDAVLLATRASKAGHLFEDITRLSANGSLMPVSPISDLSQLKRVKRNVLTTTLVMSRRRWSLE